MRRRMWFDDAAFNESSKIARRLVALGALSPAAINSPPIDMCRESRTGLTADKGLSQGYLVCRDLLGSDACF